MAIYKRLFVFWICVYTFLLTEDSSCTCETVPSAEYNISSRNDTWENSSRSCELAQLGYAYNYTTGKLFLRDNVQLGIPSTGVWIGYFKAFTEFEYKGCGLAKNSNASKVLGLAECSHTCSGKSFGLVKPPREIHVYCQCVESTSDLNNKTCSTSGELVVGSNQIAIYTPLQRENNHVPINNTEDETLQCKTSVNISKSSAKFMWSLCNSATYRQVWCKQKEGIPYLLGRGFKKWNEAIVDCVNNASLPSSAFNYTDDKPITNQAFTNIRREWTLHSANDSFSGPRMFAFITNGSKEIKFVSSSGGHKKNFLCVVRPPTTTTTTSTTQTPSPTTRTESQTKVSFSTSTSSKTATTTESSTFSFTSSTIDTTLKGAVSGAAFEESSRGSSTAAIAASVSVAVALAATAVVIVFVLRKKGKLCFAHTSLANKESKPNADNQSPGYPMSNHTYSGLQNTDTDLTVKNLNGKQGLAESEAHSYSVLEKDGFEKQRKATSSLPADVHDYFVLENPQSAIFNENGVSMNEIHPYFVLEKEGGQPAHGTTSNEANPYFILEKQTTSISTPIHASNALELDKEDVDMYQEIDSDDTYAGIDDSREENNFYDYTNTAFKDSRPEIADNVYNHINAAGDEYDHVGKGQNNVNALENNYDVTSSSI